MKNSDRPAFPVECNYHNGKLTGKQTAPNGGLELGLTKRERFAMSAMQGYCGGEWTGQSGMPHEEIAKWSVGMADALLKELEATQ